MTNKLPFKFTTDSKVFDASSKDYTDFATFQNDLLTQSGAKDFANDINTAKVTFDEAKPGDVIVLHGKSSVNDAHHVQVITEINTKEQFVKTNQGNTTDYVGKKDRLLNFVTGDDPANPTDKTYFGDKIQGTFWDLEADLYFRTNSVEFPKLDFSKLESPEFRAFNFEKMNDAKKK
jgi:hypothetical protein